jgi:class 3 adenylate cyclase
MSDEIRLVEAFKAASGPNIVSVVDALAAEAKTDLETAVKIEETRVFPDVANLPLEKNRDGVYVWKKITDVSVVATDLKSSTAVSYSKQARIGARLYQAATGNCSKVLQPFTPDFVDIQGDGLFAVFAGDDHHERAICAAISLNSLGTKLAVLLREQLGEDVPEMKESGLRIGADRGVLLGKKIGVRGSHNEPVWAGKPVNYATKCAQAADPGQIVVTARFFQDLRQNEYVRYTCGCCAGVPGQGVVPLWQKTTVESIGGEKKNAREMSGTWCSNCGAEFCRGILRGETERLGLDTGALPKWRPKPEEPTGDKELAAA